MRKRKEKILAIVIGLVLAGLPVSGWVPEGIAREISPCLSSISNWAAGEPATLDDYEKTPPPYTRPISTRTRRAVIDVLALALRESYFDAGTAEAMVSKLELQFADGDYNNINDAHSFAVQLTDDLRAVSDDRHLHVVFRTHREEEPEPEQFENHGFASVELLDSSIGYLEILTMAHGSEARVTAAEAMTRLTEARALVIDLRKNRGGAASMTDFLCSHLFTKPTLLYTLERRMDGMKRESWTHDENLGYCFPEDVPVYILVSNVTFSAAEGLAYILQQHGRAKIVGETTGGGSHPNMWRALPADFEVSIPFMRVIHPLSGGDWEGDGVEPDFLCESTAALKTALDLARDSLR